MSKGSKEGAKGEGEQTHDDGSVADGVGLDLPVLHRVEESESLLCLPSLRERRDDRVVEEEMRLGSNRDRFLEEFPRDRRVVGCVLRSVDESSVGVGAGLSSVLDDVVTMEVGSIHVPTVGESDDGAGLEVEPSFEILLVGGVENVVSELESFADLVHLLESSESGDETS